MHFWKNTLPIALLFFIRTTVFGQITIEKIDGSRTVTFPIGADISIKIPTETAKTDCDCFQTYRGELKNYEGDTITLLVNKKERRFFTEDSVAVQTVTNFRFTKSKTYTTIPNNSVIQITRHYKSRRKLDKIGGVLMLLAGAEAILVGPLLRKDVRRINDLAVLGAVGAGFVLVRLPNKKTYSTRFLWKF